MMSRAPEYRTYIHLGADILNGFPLDAFDFLRHNTAHRLQFLNSQSYCTQRHIIY
jgi:hypothetical protein